MLRHCTGKELYYRKKNIYISLKSLRNTYILWEWGKKKREKKAHVSHLPVNNNQSVLPSLHWFHLCHYLPFPQWQNLIVICYFFLDHSHVQVITLCLEEVPAPIKQVLWHIIPPHEMQIQWSHNVTHLVTQEVILQILLQYEEETAEGSFVSWDMNYAVW